MIDYYTFLSRFLYHKLETSQTKSASAGPIASKNASMVAVKDVTKFITDLGISKVSLKEKDIEAILNTIVLDGKGERCGGLAGPVLYRAVEPLLPSAGLARCPCGVCPIMRKCGDKGSIRPQTCEYFRDWLEEF